MGVIVVWVFLFLATTQRRKALFVFGGIAVEDESFFFYVLHTLQTPQHGGVFYAGRLVTIGYVS